MALIPSPETWSRALADLIRLRIAEVEFPVALAERLPKLAVFQGLDPRAATEIAAAIDWLCLPGGARLLREGEDDRALFVVLSGGLGVYVTDERGQEQQVASVGPGETVGEMSLISGEPHSAELVALRDTELLRLSEANFERLVARHPKFLRNLAVLLVRRLRDTTRRATHHLEPHNYAVIALSPHIDAHAIANGLATALSGAGKKAAVLGETHANETAEALFRIETAHDLTLYAASPANPGWMQATLRQADRALLLVDPRHAPEPGVIAAVRRLLLDRHKAEIVAVHRQRMAPAEDLVPWRTALGVHDLRHLRLWKPGDVGRLARNLAGLAVSVVFAGGGARGFAHLGVLRALKEGHVPIDAVSGASMGGIVAATVAAEWNVEDAIEAFRRSFVETNPLSDFTLPLVSLVRGRKVTNLLKSAFGDTRIEELALPFFCVSSNLSTGSVFVHEHGPVWRALRASVALPGILPPVSHEGALLIDGGVTNNMPADLAKRRARGPVIGIDVAGAYGLAPSFPCYDSAPLWRLVVDGFRGRTPGIVSFLMSAGSLGSEARRAETRAHVDLLFEPPLPNVGLTSWKRFDTAVESGYRHAVEVLSGTPETLRLPVV